MASVKTQDSESPEAPKSFDAKGQARSKKASGSSRTSVDKAAGARKQVQEQTQAQSQDWVMFDARDLVVGRLASEIARHLRGKDNSSFRPHQDSGRHVVVVNTDHLHFTGNKRQQKVYYRHTGYPGGIKSRSVKELFEKNRSTDILHNAVKGMLPRGVLGRAQLKKLRLYSGEEHQQGGQQPKMIDFAAQSAKNAKR